MRGRKATAWCLISYLVGLSAGAETHLKSSIGNGSLQGCALARKGRPTLCEGRGAVADQVPSVLTFQATKMPQEESVLLNVNERFSGEEKVREKHVSIGEIFSQGGLGLKPWLSLKRWMCVQSVL